MKHSVSTPSTPNQLLRNQHNHPADRHTDFERSRDPEMNDDSTHRTLVIFHVQPLAFGEVCIANNAVPIGAAAPAFNAARRHADRQGQHATVQLWGPKARRRTKLSGFSLYASTLAARIPRPYMCRLPTGTPC